MIPFLIGLAVVSGVCLLFAGISTMVEAGYDVNSTWFKAALTSSIALALVLVGSIIGAVGLNNAHKTAAVRAAARSAQQQHERNIKADRDLIAQGYSVLDVQTSANPSFDDVRRTIADRIYEAPGQISDFAIIVKGRCEVEYSLWPKGQSTGGSDVYYILIPGTSHLVADDGTCPGSDEMDAFMHVKVPTYLIR